MMSVMIIIKKAYFKFFGKLHNRLNAPNYMRHYIHFLKQLGVKVIGTPEYISSDAYFDGHDYSKITVGNNTTISREVMLLTHDYSIVQALRAANKYYYKGGKMDTPHISGCISIGNNCFIGARATILPNTVIGDNSIVGACAVIKGNIPPNSIVIGNPAHCIGKTDEWALSQITNSSFILTR